MTKAIIFPCEVFSPREVDSSFQNEYDAAVKTGGFEIVLYDYEQFVKDGTLKLNKKIGERQQAVLRSWMLNAEQYGDLYNKLLDKNLSLATSPLQYENLHLFPRVYQFIAEDTPRIICYEKSEIENLSIAEITAKFGKFIVKDFVKSEKGTDFPKYFDANVTQVEFLRWLKIFKEYRGKLFTGGICIKEFVELKKYGAATNEWRVFYLNGSAISVSKNSAQAETVHQVPDFLVKKYKNLPSPFYTVDFAELANGSWKILETGDGQVSGLSATQNAEAFFEALKALSF